MSDLTTELGPDGEEIIVSIDPSKTYEATIKPLNGAMPEAPSPENLSKLFEPQFVLEVTAPDGTIIPFTFKRIDPVNILSDYGSSMFITEEKLNQIQQVTQLEDRSNVSVEEWKAHLEVNALLKKNAIIFGVIKPVITEETYDLLVPKVRDDLYSAITGGITSGTELVEHFRKTP